MRLSGAEILLECLIAEGVELFFGYPGGVVLPLYNRFAQYPQIKHVLVRHEQSAAHAAEGYARVSGTTGVCLATSGPGATNLVTGIANAYMDSVPMVVLTGNVARDLIGRDGFQEADITGITLPITKHNTLVMRASEVATAIKEAFHIASTGRKGPVLVDIPKDVFIEEAEYDGYPQSVHLRGYPIQDVPIPSEVERAAAIINGAKKPVVLAGHGVVQSGAAAELQHRCGDGPPYDGEPTRPVAQREHGARPQPHHGALDSARVDAEYLGGLPQRGPVAQALEEEGAPGSVTLAQRLRNSARQAWHAPSTFRWNSEPRTNEQLNREQLNN